MALGIILDPKYHNEGLFISHLSTLGVPPDPKCRREGLVGPSFIYHMIGLLALHNLDL